MEKERKKEKTYYYYCLWLKMMYFKLKEKKEVLQAC